MSTRKSGKKGGAGRRMNVHGSKEMGASWRLEEAKRQMKIVEESLLEAERMPDGREKEDRLRGLSKVGDQINKKYEKALADLMGRGE